VQPPQPTVVLTATESEKLCRPFVGESGIAAPPVNSGVGNYARNITGSTANRFARLRLAGIHLVLAALTWCVFSQTIDHPFVNYDDQNYVYQNPRIAAGLTWSGTIAAFTQTHARNWHPLTTLSHMLDCQLFGLNPAGHHLTNILLHTVAVLLLFAVLNAISGAFWRSAAVAAIFAIHPLRVESVAWIAERKDVLSGVFFMLTLTAYAWYVRWPTRRRYIAVIASFALALMAKPTVIMLPVLLFLLDYWPFRRLTMMSDDGRPNGDVPFLRQLARFGRSTIFLEKIPLAVLSVAVGIITLVAQRYTVGYSESIPLTSKVSNAFIAIVTYVEQMFWPAKLAVFYPNWGDREPAMVAVVAALLLGAITALAIGARRRAPYVVVGWLWYLIALLPVIGLVQVGLQGRADRYTYLPQIGLYIAVVWALGDLCRTRVHRRVITAVTIAVIILLTWRASIQAAFWRDTETLWAHALRVTESNDVAHYNVAGLLLDRGRLDEAIQHYQAALRASSDHESRTHLSPGIVQNALGNAFARKNDINAATLHYRRAIELRPDFSDARVNLSAMLLRQGDIAGAIAEYEKVASTPPEDGLSHERLADMLLKAKRYPEAVTHYRRAVELTPNSVNALSGLSWLLATNSGSVVDRSGEGVRLAERANELTHGNDPVVLRILAVNYAVAGRKRDALTTAERALSLARTNSALVQVLTQELESYRAKASP